MLLCMRPVVVRKGDRVSQVRCRQCRPCLTVRRRYWTAAAIDQLEDAAALGCRTWFGTLTFDPVMQDELKERAFENNLISDWGDVPSAEQKVLLVREAVDELQCYWKRLRHAGLRFKYLAALESGQSGKPHAHFLLHEADAERPIRKRDLEAGWRRGITRIRLAAGEKPRATVHYVVKGLGETSNQRVLTSARYRPNKAKAMLARWTVPPASGVHALTSPEASDG